MQGTQHAKSTVRAGAVAISAAFAVQRGVPIHELREMCGVDGVELMRPDARIDAQVLAQLWRNLELKFPGQLLSLEMCRAAPLTLAGDIPHGAQFADNLGEVVDLFRKNSTLLGDRLEIDVGGPGEQDAVHITITHPLDAVAYLDDFYRDPGKRFNFSVGPDGSVLTFLDFDGAELGRELRVGRGWLED